MTWGSDVERIAKPVWLLVQGRYLLAGAVPVHSRDQEDTMAKVVTFVNYLRFCKARSALAGLCFCCRHP